MNWRTKRGTGLWSCYDPVDLARAELLLQLYSTLPDQSAKSLVRQIKIGEYAHLEFTVGKAPCEFSRP
jgi:hypothetical protein